MTTEAGRVIFSAELLESLVKIIRTGDNGNYLKTLKKRDQSTNFAKHQIWIDIQKEFETVKIKFTHIHNFMSPPPLCQTFICNILQLINNKGFRWVRTENHYL